MAKQQDLNTTLEVIRRLLIDEEKIIHARTTLNGARFDFFDAAVFQRKKTNRHVEDDRIFFNDGHLEIVTNYS